ncbi:ribonucleases P/MRP protein subunit pop7 [Geranomyces variabilis]|nr:ribonucleases P/MRP protein subunit pop7 [Geranomyces variabilis]
MARTKGKARRGAAGHAFREASKLKASKDKAGQVQAGSLKRKAEDDQPEVVKEARLDDLETGTEVTKESEEAAPEAVLNASALNDADLRGVSACGVLSLAPCTYRLLATDDAGTSTSGVIQDELSADLASEAIPKAKTAPDGIAGLAIESSAKSKTKANNGSVRHKRAVQRPPTLATDIYVSRKSTVQAQAKRARTLLDGPDFTFLTIHGLGAAINRAIELALHLKEQYQDQIAWTISLSTVTLVDDVEPEELDDDVSTETRQNSAVHIRVVKVNGAPAHAE